MENFNINRFWKILKFELTNSRKMYIISAIVIATLMVLCFILYHYFHYPIQNLYVLIAIYIPMFLTLNFSVWKMNQNYVLGVMNQFDKQKAMRTLLLPGSSLEKFLAKLLTYWFIPMLCIIAIVCIIPMKFQSTGIWNDDGTYQELSSIVKKWYEFGAMFCFSIMCTSLILLGCFLNVKERLIAIIPLSVLLFFSYHINTPSLLQDFGKIFRIQQGDVATLSQVIICIVFVVISAAIAYYKFKRLTLNCNDAYGFQRK